MTRRLALLTVTALGLTACQNKTPSEQPPKDSSTTEGATTDEKTPAPPAPDAPAEDEATNSEPAGDSAKEDAERAGRALSTAELREIMGALGCPEGALQDAGCTVCPPKLHPNAEDYEKPFVAKASWRGKILDFASETSKRPMHAMAGTFAGVKGEGTLLIYSGCSNPKREEHWDQDQNLVLLEARGESYAPVAHFTSKDSSMRACAFPSDASGAMHVVCAHDISKGGADRMEAKGLHVWGEDEERFGKAPKMYTEGEEHPKGLYEITFDAVTDIDADGDDDLVVTEAGTQKRFAQGPERWADAK